MTHTINVETLRAMLEQKKPVTVLDIRHTDEWAEWAIPGSINLDAYDALKAREPGALAGLTLPADRPVVTICGGGVVSQIAADQLHEQGLEALSLTGGMKAWSLAWNSAEVSFDAAQDEPFDAAQDEPLSDSQVRVIQVRRTGKGCLSYLIGSEGVAAVIDPALDPEIYLGLAQQQGWTIRYVLDTHIHADHLSRARKLAEQAGASLCLPVQAHVAYPFQPLQDGQSLTIGAANLVALSTPGHVVYGRYAFSGSRRPA
jgi:rhodanese-related sulfurtransferase